MDMKMLKCKKGNLMTSHFSTLYRLLIVILFLAPLDASESTSSDGEFGDDELLQILRRRRAEYEQQLQHLDELIQNVQ